MWALRGNPERFKKEQRELRERICKVASIRRVEERVEVDGEERTMVLITNNLSWSPRSVCDLYHAALGHRSLLQTGQAKPEAEQFSGSQCPCRAVAGLHGTVGLCATSISGLSFRVGPQLCAAFCGDPLGIVGAAQPTEFTQKPWDSIGTNASARSAP
jgi:hypothetical protein